MDQLMEVIRKRISIRRYQDKPLTEETVQNILEAARHAPTARNMQELEYRVITNKAIIEQCSEAISAVLKAENIPAKTPPPGQKFSFFYSAPLLIIITGKKENPWSATDAALAAQNIMLYATSLGLGSVFIGMARFLEKAPQVMKKLKISEDRTIAATVICGYPDEKPEPKEKKLVAEYFK